MVIASGIVWSHTVSVLDKLSLVHDMRFFLQAKAGQLCLERQRQLPESDARDRDFLLPLVAEVVGEARSVLVFCASRKQCQSCAELIADLLPAHVPPVSEVCIPTWPCGHHN